MTDIKYKLVVTKPGIREVKEGEEPKKDEKQKFFKTVIPVSLPTDNFVYKTVYKRGAEVHESEPAPQENFDPELMFNPTDITKEEYDALIPTLKKVEKPKVVSGGTVKTMEVNFQRQLEEQRAKYEKEIAALKTEISILSKKN